MNTPEGFGKVPPREVISKEEAYEADPAVLEMLMEKMKGVAPNVDEITLADAATRIMRAAEEHNAPYTLTSFDNDAHALSQSEIERAVKAAEMQRGTPDIDVVEGKVVSPGDKREAA